MRKALRERERERERGLFRWRLVLGPPALDFAGRVYCRILTPDGDVHDEEVLERCVHCVVLEPSGATPDSVRCRFSRLPVNEFWKCVDAKRRVARGPEWNPLPGGDGSGAGQRLRSSTKIGPLST